METRGCGSTNPRPGVEEEAWLATLEVLVGDGTARRLVEDDGDGEAAFPPTGDRGDVVAAAAAAAATQGTAFPVMPAAASSPDLKPS